MLPMPVVFERTLNRCLPEDPQASPLQRAVHQADGATVRELLPHASPDERNRAGWTLLMLATEASDHGAAAEVVQALLDAGADPGLRDLEYRTALHHAVLWGSGPCVQRLLPVSDPNAQTMNGRTPLMLAMIRQTWGAAQALLPVSDVLLRDHEGRTVEAWLPADDPVWAGLVGQRRRACEQAVLARTANAVMRDPTGPRARTRL